MYAFSPPVATRNLVLGEHVQVPIWISPLERRWKLHGVAGIQLQKGSLEFVTARLLT